MRIAACRAQSTAITSEVQADEMILRISVQAMATKSKRTAFDVKNFLARIGNAGTFGSYRLNQTLFSQGDPADSVFYIAKGKVQVSVLSNRGKEAVLAILGPGEFVGEASLSGQLQRMASAVTITECSIVRIERRAMQQALHDEPRFSEMFILYLLHRGARAEEDMTDRLFNSSEKRLARILLQLANVGRQSKPEPINPRVSQETLAEMVGTTRARVSSFMNKFRRLGFIEYNGEISVHSSLLNVVLNNKETTRPEKRVKS